ncbi:hypothetical protein [Mycoplasma wenyonii]|nr:hypothetical protein [Mycoplasma wenyonii]
MAEIVRQQSVGQEVIVGCFETTGSQKPLWTQSLYVCINLSADKPEAFWFHYNWKSPVSQRVKQITSINKKRAGFSTLHFSGGSIDIMNRLRPWAGSSFNPSQNCQITKQGDNYELTCGNKQPPSNKSFSQTIKSSDFHRPTTLSLS